MSLPVARLGVFGFASAASLSLATIVRLTTERREARKHLVGRCFSAVLAKTRRIRGGMMFLGIVSKSHRGLTFLAIIGGDVPAMKLLGMISILALLAMSGAAISDQFLTADQHVAQGVE